MVSFIGIVLTSVAAILPIPGNQTVSVEQSVAATQCCCCKNKACTCGMEQPQASEPKTKKNRKNSEPCCGNSSSAPQPENNAMLSFTTYSLKKFQQDMIVSVVVMGIEKPADCGNRNNIHSSSSPPVCTSFPLRI
jgi:hypothetical protein